MKRAAAGLSLLVVAFLSPLLAAQSPEAVEQWYSRGFYPSLLSLLAGISTRTPLSLAEFCFFLLSLALPARLLRAAREARRTSPRRALGSLLADLTLTVGVLSFAFVALWALNYRRIPLAVSAGLDVRPAGIAELSDLAGELVTQTNRSRELLAERPEGADATSTPSATIAGVLSRAPAGFAAAARHYPALAGRCFPPKALLSSEAFSWLGLTGIYSPFTGEANVNVRAPLLELPFSASHEVAHQLGFAREDEANFVGYLACRFHPDPDFIYAGLLGASIHASNALLAADRASWAKAEAGRSEAVKRDLQTLREWSERHEGPAARAAEKVNDAYLRAQGQRDGVRSYGRMVDLLLAEHRARPGRASIQEE
jgi:hypothetical protein